MAQGLSVMHYIHKIHKHNRKCLTTFIKKKNLPNKNTFSLQLSFDQKIQLLTSNLSWLQLSVLSNIHLLRAAYLKE